MFRKMFTLAFMLWLVMFLIIPGQVLTQGSGRVLNRRTRTLFSSINDALAASRSGDVLLVAGRLEGIVDLSLAPGAIMIVGQSNPLGSATISVPSCPVNGAVIDASSRNGRVQLIGLTIEVPDNCIGILSNANLGTGDGKPLTVRGCRIRGISPSTHFTGGIALFDESGGPYLFLNNTISRGHFDFGIVLDGDILDSLRATIRNNDIGGRDTVVGAGIVITDILASATVVVDRNTIDGGGPSVGSMVGIALGWGDDNVGGQGVTVQRNTVVNFSNPNVRGRGIVVDGSPGAKILANAVRDNFLGIVVDPGHDSGETPLINNNNITCSNLTACKAAGYRGLFFGLAGYALDARNNYWGTNTGPESTDIGTICPEATGSRCNGPAGGGTGLPVETPFAVDCGTGPGQVMVCPFRSSPNSSAGA